MADSAALKLGNIISSSVSGSMQALTSGIKGSLSQGAGFSTMSSALSKGLSRIDKTEKDKEKRRSEEASRDRGFAEERDNEKKRFDAIFMAVTKGMAINVDKIQKDVSEILNLLRDKEKTPLLDMLKGMLAGLVALPKKLVELLGKVLGDLKSKFKLPDLKIADYLKNVFRGIGDFFKKIKFPGIDSFTKGIKSLLDTKFPKVTEFLKRLGSIFEKIKFPKTAALLGEFLNDLKKLLRFDDIKKLLKLDDIALKAKKFITAFAIVFEFAKFQLDELKTLGTNKFGDLKNTFGNKLGELKSTISSGFDDLKKSTGSKLTEIKASVFGSLLDIGKRFGAFFDLLGTTLSSKINESLGILKNSNMGKAISSLGDDIASSLNYLKSGVQKTFIALADDFSEIQKSFKSPISSIVGETGLAKTAGGAGDIAKAAGAGADTVKIAEAVGETVKTVDAVGGAVKDASLLGGTISKISGFFAGFKPMLEGPLKFLGELTDVTAFVKGIGRVLGPLGLILSVFDGLTVALDTEYLQATFGVEQVGMRERISGFIGGFIGGIGGLFDFLGKMMGIQTSEGAPIQEYLTQTVTLITGDILDGIKSFLEFIGKIITSEPAQKVFGAAKELFTTAFNGLSSLFSFLGDVLFSETAMKIYSSIGTYIGEQLKTALNMFKNVIDLVVGIFTLDWKVIKDAGMNIFDGIISGFKNTFEMIGSLLTPVFAKMGNLIVDSLNWIIEKINKALPDRFAITKLGRLDDSFTGYTGSSSMASAAGSGGFSVANASPTPQQAALPPAAAAGAPMAAPASRSGTGNSYTEADLKSLGLNIKGGGVTQTSGATISPSTIGGAQWVQGNISGARFTGFNDKYHQEEAPTSSHTRGLAFDMTIPPNLAQNDSSRQSIAKSISASTGAWVKDEYAEPTAKSTGGHFHVDFSKAKGVDNGRGTFGGGPPTPKYVPIAADTSSFMGPQQDSGLMGPVQESDFMGPVQESVSIGPVQDSGTGLRSPYAQQQTQALNGILNTVKDQYSLSTGTRNISRYQLEEARRQTELYRNVDEYQQERDKLQEEFNSELKGIFSPLVQGLLGPAGEARKEDERRAGRNITGTLLSNDFEKLGKKIFGSQQGAAIGETFQKLAGVYLDQFIDKALAPALGMDSKYLNRSINTFLEGYKQTQPEIKRLEKEIEKTKTELKTYQAEKGVITSADIIRAGGRKGFTAEEQANLTEINRLNEIIRVNQEQLDKTKAVRKEYKTAAIGDLVYGMTGVAITPRNVLEDIYGNRGSEGLVEDLASIFGAPVAGLFKASPVGTDAASKEVEMRRQLTTEQVTQTRAVNTENIQAHSQLQQNVLTAQTGLFEKLLNGMSSVFTSGADMFKGALGSIGINVGGAGGGNILERLGGDIAKDVVNTISGNKPSGTAIPGLVAAINPETGETYYTDINPEDGSRFYPGGGSVSGGSASGKFGMGNISLGSVGSSAMGRVGSFASKTLDNFITSKISSSLGGGFAGQVGGSLIADFGKSLFSGGNFNFFQSLGNTFGVKLGPGASMTDFMSGFKNVGGNMMMNMGGTIANLGANMGSQFVTELGAGMAQSGAGVAFGSAGTGTMQIGQALGEVGGILGPAMMSYNLSKMIGGEYKTGLPVNEIAAIASYFVGPIAGVIGGLVNRAFGRGPKKVRASRVVGDLKYDASNLRTEQDWKQKGGWFRSSRSGTDVKQFTSEETDAVNDAIASVYDSLKAVTEGLKLDISSAYNFSKTIRLDMTKLTPEQQQKKWEEVFQQFNDEMYKFTFGASLEAARNIITDQSGNEVLETYEQTLIRLTQIDQLFNLAMNSVLEIAGKNIESMFTRLTGQLDNATKILVADMKDAYTAAFGGIEELNRVQSEYVNLFYTEEEKSNQTIRDSNEAITEALKDTNISATQFTQGFGTVAELQAMDQETFMEQQRLRYRTMVEDFEKTYGWMLTSTEENVQEYGRLEKGIKDAGSSFMTAAQLTYEAANKLTGDAADAEVVNTERTIGTGAGPAGELGFGPSPAPAPPSTSAPRPPAPAPAPRPPAPAPAPATPVTPAVPALTTGTLQGSIERLNTSGSFTDKQNFYDDMIASGDITKANLDKAIIQYGRKRGGLLTGPESARTVSNVTEWIDKPVPVAVAPATTPIMGTPFNFMNVDYLMTLPWYKNLVANGTIAAKAVGGSYGANKPMIVGEVGPEIMMPNAMGSIIPTHKIIEAVQNASSLDSQTRNLLTSARPETNSAANAYMLQQAMNTAMSAEKEIRASINNNNSMVNQTVNNVSSPQTNIVSSGTGGVRSDNPMMNSFSRSSTRPRSF